MVSSKREITNKTVCEKYQALTDLVARLLNENVVERRGVSRNI